MNVRASTIRRLAGLVAVLVTALLVAGAPASAVPAQDARAAAVQAGDRHGPTLRVDGNVAHRLRLRTADLADLPQHTLTVTFQSGSGSQTHTYTGPLLLDVLAKAEPRFDPDVKNDKLRHVVLATGSDGYRAALAWGEIDPSFANKAVLVAVTEDGQPTGDGRARIVVPGDQFGGRYVASLVRLRLTAPAW